MAVTMITKKFRFEASHVLPRHPGKCSRLHGHSWELEVAISGAVKKETGFVLDYGILKDLVQREIVDQVDHQHLGCYNMLADQAGFYDVPPIIPLDFYPSSENLVELFGKILIDRLAELPRGEGEASLCLEWVSLKETCTSEAIWYPHSF